MSLSDFFSGLTGAVSQGINTSVGGPFDFTGSLVNAGQTFDPSQFNPATYAGTYGNLLGGTDQYGQTTQQVQSSDPGSQLQDTQQGAPQQNQNQPQQQPQAPQNAQPPLGSLLAAINARGYQGNPYVIGGGGAVPNVPPGVNPALVRQGAPPAVPAAAPVPVPAPPAVAPATAPAPSEAISTPTVRADLKYAPPAAQEPSTTGIGRGAGGEPLHGGGEVTEVPPAGQQAAQMPPQVQQIVGNFLRSPIGQLIDRLMGGEISQMLQQPQGLAALQQQYANQVPRGYTAQNEPRWVTPEEYQQYLRTGQMPSRTPGGGQPLRGGGQVAQGPPAQATPTSTAPNVFRTGAQSIQDPSHPFFTRDPNKSTLPGQANLTGTVDSSKVPQPSPDVQRAIAQGEAAQAPYPTNTIQGAQANVMATGGPGYTDLQGNRRSGMSRNAIAGVFMNVRDESGFNPAERVRDQDKYMATHPGADPEARYAHGLYQDGGPDWPLFQQFLNGRDWRDPTLQTQFMMQHFASRNPRAWNEMNNAPTSGQAAVVFLNNYLIPAAQYRRARAARYARSNQQVAMQ